MTALFAYMLIILPLNAEVLAENEAFYTDKKTGITLVIAEVMLTGGYQIDEIKTPSPVEQLMVLNSKLIDKEINDKLAEYPSSQATNMRALWENNKRYYRVVGIVRDMNAPEMLITFRSYDKNSTQTVRLDLKAGKKNSVSRKHFQN